jgi:PAS domain S-box-containing protein
MAPPRRDRQRSDPLERFRDMQVNGTAGSESLTELLHELEVHQEELTAQNSQMIETQHALEESRDRYVDLYDFAPIGFIMMTTAGLISELNLTAATLLGTERDRIIGLPFHTFVSASDKPKFSEHLRQCRQVDRVLTTVELTLHVGHPPLSVQLLTKLQASRIGNERNFMTAIIDISERKRLEQERRSAEESRDRLMCDREIARARADAKDHFLATLSHELRTPLTPIVATLSNSRLVSLAPEPLQTALQTVKRNLELEVRLIDDLLDVTRISRDRLVLTHERIDLHGVIQDVVDMLNTEIQRRDVRVVMNMNAPAHSVVGDPIRLRQVFWNLLGNAIKFTDAGGTITVTSAAEPPGSVRVTVSDTGAGMDEDLTGAINDLGPDSRATPIQPSSGLGLGLVICRGVVNAHGGTLTAISAGKGRGSTFVVRIPIAAHMESWDRSEGSTGATSEPRSQLPRILLVEDHRDSADMLSQLLVLNDYEVTVARTVQEALGMAADDFDILISDIRLPDGSGLDLMRRLRSRQPIRGIAISGFGTEEDRRRSLEAGFGTHLTKPVDFNRLLEAIENVAPSASE